MNNFVLPDILPNYKASSPCYYYEYQSNETNSKSRIHFTTHCLSIVVDGIKQLRSARGIESFSQGSTLLFTPGNYVSYEVVSRGATPYKSILLFFNSEIIHDFFSQIEATDPVKSKETCLQHLSFDANDYLGSYMGTITELLADKKGFSPALQKIKLLELLTYLYEQDGSGVFRLLDCPSLPASEANLVKVVENNIYSDLSIEDLAFLCNKSLSTFKRRFKEHYDTSPGKWIRTRRLEHAADQIKNSGKKPVEVFYDAGYADYSSFSHSFKKQFGISPKEYKVS